MSTRSAAVAAVVATALVSLTVAVSGDAAGGKPRAYTSHFVGAQISGGGLTAVAAYKVTDSLNGPGAAVQVSKVTSTALPLSGTDTGTVYYGNGTVKARDIFTLGAPDANGISAIAGKGTCTSGTGKYRGQKCTYTFAGTYDTNTSRADVIVKGTVTK
jgi:hypothetical protein